MGDKIPNNTILNSVVLSEGKGRLCLVHGFYEFYFSFKDSILQIKKSIYFLSYLFLSESLDVRRQTFLLNSAIYSKGIEIHIPDFIQMQHCNSWSTSKNLTLNCSTTKTPVVGLDEGKGQNSSHCLSAKAQSGDGEACCFQHNHLCEVGRGENIALARFPNLGCQSSHCQWTTAAKQLNRVRRSHTFSVETRSLFVIFSKNMFICP